MSNEDWLMSNEKSHYESLKLQDVLNKRLIKELQTELKAMKQVKTNVVLDNLIKPFKCCKETDKCDIQCDDCKMVYNL